MGLDYCYYYYRMILIMVLIMKSCYGCFEDERVALLQLKSSFNYSSIYTSYYYWRITNVEEDCCKWEGVECSSSTGRLTGLFLFGDQIGVIEWKMNATLFFPFQQLATLSLQYFYIAGSVQNQSFDKLSTLQHLESLDLSYNHFHDKTILSSIGTISSLKSLSLNYSSLNTVNDIQGLVDLKNLEVLHLSGNNLDNSIFSIVGGLPSLKSLSLGWNSLNDSKGLSKLVKLEVLDLHVNNFNNNILLSVASLSSLKQLDLSYCGLEGTIDLQDIGVHRNLSALFLDYITPINGSNVQIHSLGAYPNLKTISLRGNNFEGPIFVQEKGDLFNLEELFLDYSSLDDKSFESLRGLSSLKRLSLQYLNGTIPAEGFFSSKNLEYLDLSFNVLDSNILKEIEKMTSLKTLVLYDCRLKGTLPEGFCNLRNLEVLHLSYNELSGELPWCIGNLTSLQILDLSENHFNGSIYPLRSLTSLEELSFSRNLFQVPLSLEPFFNHSKLKSLDGEDNHIIYEDVEVRDSSAPKFQLEQLWLSSSRNDGIFPEFLWHQHDLQILVLLNIQLRGEFPYWLLENNTNLETLNLANTSLSGPLHLPHHSHEYLKYLNISNNDLNGSIPTQIGHLLPKLFGLDLSSNTLSGQIPADLEIVSLILSNNHFEGQIFLNTPDCNYLRVLRVDNNTFSGNIPHNLFSCTRLVVFDARNNHLSGKIPGWIANMSSLQLLDLSKNRFSGSLPAQLGPSQIKEVYLSENMLQGSLGTSFYNCSELMILDLSHNNFSGTIPKWIGKLPNLRYLLMSHNSLEGEIPIQLCSLEQLSLIDLSNNNLSGHVLSCIRPASKPVNENGTYAEMEQPVEFTTKSITYSFQGRTFRLILGIDLSSNNFSGTIPTQIGNLSMIQVLNLSHNSLIGRIPESFSNLAQIESLDLSYNNLDGKIPSQLLQLNFLSHFSVAHNNLSGRTPEMVAQFATFESTSYEGNPYLCGRPLPISCSPEVPRPPNSGKEEEEEEGGFMDMDMDVFYVSCVVSYIVVLGSFGVVLYVNPYWRRRWFYMIEVMLRNCYYFIEDHLLFPLFKLRAS